MFAATITVGEMFAATVTVTAGEIACRNCHKLPGEIAYHTRQAQLSINREI